MVTLPQGHPNSVAKTFWELHCPACSPRGQPRTCSEGPHPLLRLPFLMRHRCFPQSIPISSHLVSTSWRI